MAVGLKYINDDDKCYGITGMVVAMMVWDNEDLLSSVDLDATDNENIEFHHDFYFCGNPRISPRYTWNKMVKNYKMMMEMFIANVLCRQYVLHQSTITPQLKQLVYNHLEEEGCDYLEKDEIKELFEQSYESLQRIFMHSGVKQIVKDFALNLLQQRTLTQAEVLHHLQALSML